MMPHEADCPDPDQHGGVHVTCPCPHCMDTGFLSADPHEEQECPYNCGAHIEYREALLEAQRLYQIGHLHQGRFRLFQRHLHADTPK